ncbi:MAG: DUF3108 domain-containing protein [Hydrogenophaga sp.]
MNAAPRWSVLLPLTAFVLGVHLWLLADSLSPQQDDTSLGATRAQIADRVAAPTGLSGDATVTPAHPRALNVSTVRWITPPPSVGASAPPARPRTPQTVARAAEVPLAPEPAQPAKPDSVTSAAPGEGFEPLQPGPVQPPDERPPEQGAGAATREPPVSAPQGPDTLSLPPSTPPSSTTLLYELGGQVRGMHYTAEAQLHWHTDGERYEAELSIRAFLVGSRVQSSRGRVGPEGVMPERFGDRRRSSEKATHFDAPSQRIRFSSNAPDAPMLPGAQDRLSVFLQLAGLLQARPQAYPEGSHLDLQVAGSGSADLWRFTVGPIQMLDLPAGQVSARKLVREPRREHDSRVEVWLAPDLQHLPVRIRLSEADGGQIDQRLRQWPSPPSAP